MLGLLSHIEFRDKVETKMRFLKVLIFASTLVGAILPLSNIASLLCSDLSAIPAIGAELVGRY
jgi:hypothetical protein